jgi:hypothetical protein
MCRLERLGGISYPMMSSGEHPTKSNFLLHRQLYTASLHVQDKDCRERGGRRHASSEVGTLV